MWQGIQQIIDGARRKSAEQGPIDPAYGQVWAIEFPSDEIELETHNTVSDPKVRAARLASFAEFATAASMASEDAHELARDIAQRTQHMSAMLRSEDPAIVEKAIAEILGTEPGLD
ncbi:MAG: hypothetical protein JWM81_947 [Candidatus Saccharibacteria bacterium]|nr:hypothetical protein [Candidatus Saccharibacteria bacterium]